MTQEAGGGGSKLKFKVKEIGGVVMYDSKARWRWDFKVKKIKIYKQWLYITQELEGGGSRLKYKVKEIGAMVMYNSRDRWRTEVEIKT